MRRLYSGLIVSAIVAGLAQFIAQRYEVPDMAAALLLGMSLNLVINVESWLPGLQLAMTTLLRIGIALLGFRIALSDLGSLGWIPFLIVLVAIGSTIVFGLIVSRCFGFSRQLGILTGGAVAICGASAALALSCVLPKSTVTQRNTVFTIMLVTALSTAAMIIYPFLVRKIGLDSHQAAIFIGGSIHDVAQVVGAGYSLSPEIGVLGTFVKLLRVAMLVPVVLAVSIMVRSSTDTLKTGVVQTASMPWFLIGFVVFMIISSTGIVPLIVTDLSEKTSHWLLITAIAALGIQTTLRDICSVGWDIELLSDLVYELN